MPHHHDNLQTSCLTCLADSTTLACKHTSPHSQLHVVRTRAVERDGCLQLNANVLARMQRSRRARKVEAKVKVESAVVDAVTGKVCGNCGATKVQRLSADCTDQSMRPQLMWPLYDQSCDQCSNSWSNSDPAACSLGTG